MSPYLCFISFLYLDLYAVYSFYDVLEGIYTGLIKTDIGKWNSGGYFHRACAICEKSWWKVPEKSG